MNPMIDMMMAPGAATALITVGPAVIGVGCAVIFGVAWMARQTAEELRRVAARDWEIGRIATTKPARQPLAA